MTSGNPLTNREAISFEPPVKVLPKDVGPVLLTGLSGFIGPHVGEYLVAHGLAVVAVVRRRTTECEAFAELQGIDLVVGDLTDAKFLGALKTQPSSIVHLAANSGRKGEDFDTLYRDNVLSTAQLLSFAKRSGCEKFIHISSVSVHGRVLSSPLSAAHGSEAPTSYGKTKLMAEEHLKRCGHGVGIVALRLPGVLGPKAPPHLLSSLVTKAVAGDEVTMHHADSLFNNVVHVSDLSRFIVQLLSERLNAAFDAFPLASSKPIRMREGVELVKLQVGSTSPVREVPSMESSFFIDDSRARSVFGYTSSSTSEAIARFIKYYDASGL